MPHPFHIMGYGQNNRFDAAEACECRTITKKMKTKVNFICIILAFKARATRSRERKERRYFYNGGKGKGKWCTMGLLSVSCCPLRVVWRWKVVSLHMTALIEAFNDSAGDECIALPLLCPALLCCSATTTRCKWKTNGPWWEHSRCKCLAQCDTNEDGQKLLAGRDS